MKSYCDLLKENIISFKQQLLDKYYLMNLNEEECIVLLRLYDYSQCNDNFLNIDALCKKTSLAKDALSNVIANLVKKGYMSLNMTENDNNYLEEFSLEDAFRELSYVIEDGDRRFIENTNKEKIRFVITLFESKLNKSISPMEKEMISKWYYEYEYSHESIVEAINSFIGSRSLSVTNVNRKLFSLSKDEITEEELALTKELLKRRYGDK